MSPSIHQRMVVVSVALAAAEPPPDTLTGRKSGVEGKGVDLTGPRMIKKKMPESKASLREQVLEEQLHPVPAIDTKLSRLGSASVPVTVPLVGPAPDAFDTVTV